jgi:hypothetical protein
MPPTRINCPNCRQPVTADIEQLFDMNVDPSAKQSLLSGAVNVIQCPVCGYQGSVATPIVYHDPEKELLLTFFPPDLTRTRDDQERMIGPFLNQIMGRLPQEKRKGYLLRPQTVLTMQGLVERILEADGITREMIQAQQQRLSLIQRLMDSSDEVIEEIARQDDAIIDEDFFSILNRVGEAAAMQGDRQSAQRLSDLQKKLLPITTAGKKIEHQSKEMEAAIKDLQSAGRSLTREKLVDLVIASPSETRLGVYVSFARPAMDYAFFQTFGERIEHASGEEQNRLKELRDTLLEITQEYDRQVQARLEQSRQLIDELLKEEDLPGALQQVIPLIDDFFVQTLNSELEAARKAGNLERSAKLQQITAELQQASQAPPEITLIEEMLELENDQERRAWLENHREEITQPFLETLTSILAQSQGSDPELYSRLQSAYRAVVRFTMESNLK